MKGRIPSALFLCYGFGNKTNEYPQKGKVEKLRQTFLKKDVSLKKF